MSPSVEHIVERIQDAEAELARQVDAQRRHWHYRVHRGHVWFDCPIKHARAIHAPHARYHLFFDYGDAEGYRRRLGTLRKTLGREPARGRRS